MWDKLDIVGKLIASVLLPVALFLGGFFINSGLQDRAAKQKVREVAIDVLKSGDDAPPALRDWAQGVFNDMLNEASKPLDAKGQDELKNGLPTPSNGAELLQTYEGGQFQALQAAAVATVESAITVPLTANQKDALVDLVVWAGSDALKASGIAGLATEGKLDQVPAALRQYVATKHFPVPAIKKKFERRVEQEILLWNKPG